MLVGTEEPLVDSLSCKYLKRINVGYVRIGIEAHYAIYEVNMRIARVLSFMVTLHARSLNKINMTLHNAF